MRGSRCGNDDDDERNIYSNKMFVSYALGWQEIFFYLLEEKKTRPTNLNIATAEHH